MYAFANYQFAKKLHESPNSLVYRGRRLEDNQPVIVKILQQLYPPPEKIARFKREYERTRSLHQPGIIEVYRCENIDNRWAIILEDFGGESLDRFIGTHAFSITKFLNIALKITDILGRVHQQHVIHKDINPTNIIFNPETDELKLIDFGISTTLSCENSSFSNPNVLEGTLAYISPEQTGRMNRAIDYRTDFYSLGATFYQLLTGQLPFPTQDALELVHSHLAKQPTPPHKLNPKIPPILSEIVLKLMAKNAEDRYLSASSLQYDLNQCLEQWQSQGKIEPFPLARHNISDRLQIPQKLYGREAEIAKLLAAFERVAGGALRLAAVERSRNSATEGEGERFDSRQLSEVETQRLVPSGVEVSRSVETQRPTGRRGSAELMLVSGYSGIGKSALIQEIYKPLTRQKGYFIAGKFDQFQRDIPYASLIQAFRSLMRQILTENEAEIESWRDKLLSELGNNGGVIVEVIPEIELIIGSQPPVVPVAPAEARNRFNFAFQQFIQVFTKPEHPLVIFLDDLQWADLASLELIQRLMSAANNQYLFFIGAYRDNEVSATHPLVQCLAEIEKAQVATHKILLSPLTLTDITQLLADTLFVEPEIARPLAELLQAKAGGNPFFTLELLKSLEEEGAFFFDPEMQCWQWNLEQITARSVTDNVVELMTQKVKKLPENTQRLLQLAACIGNQFDLKTLAIIFEQFQSETAAALRPALAAGFILPLSNAYQLLEVEVEGLTEELVTEYKFAHDRIQQAAYSLVPEAETQVIHWRIGRLLLENTPDEERESRIFEIVNQLNRGRALIAKQSERNELARLNLKAGRKAKASAAREPAFNYLQMGLSLLAHNSWSEQYDLTLGLFVEAVEASYIIANYEEMERLSNSVLQNARTLLDKVRVYETKIQACCAQTEFVEAIDTGLEIIALLGVELPEHPGPNDLAKEMEQIGVTLGSRSPQALLDLPVLTDAQKRAAMRIMNYLFSPAFIARNQLSSVIWCRQVNLSLQYGISADSALGYVGYGLILCLTGEFAKGYQFGNLAVQILEKFNDRTFKARILVFYQSFIRPYKEALRVVSSLSLEAYQSGVETGDLEFAASNMTAYAYSLYLSGLELMEVEKAMVKALVSTRQIQQQAYMHWTQIYRQAVSNLLGENKNPCQLVGETYNEKEMLYIHQKNNDRSALVHLYSHKLPLCYLFEEFEAAVENADQFKEYEANVGSSFLLFAPYLYDALARLALYPQASETEREKILEQVEQKRAKMKLWAEQAPMNFLHKSYLIEAERARVLGEEKEAREYYDLAITHARENEYLNEEALSYELAGRFYLARNQPHVARHYLQDARYTYQRWGAIAKVKHLEARYPQFFSTAAPQTLNTSLPSSVTTSGETTASSFDFNSVLKSARAVSGEIVLEKLLETVMQVAIENAGAQTGFLLLEEAGNWVIEARGAANGGEITTLQSLPFDTLDAERQIPFLSTAIVNLVARTGESVVLTDATQEGDFTRDAYILATQPKSILCVPLRDRGNLTSIIYLENNLTPGAFTRQRVEVMTILASQAAISIENARLYHNLEEKVIERTAELAEANAEITVLNERLKKENMRMSAELDVAKELQFMVLPNPEELQAIPHLDIAGFMEPADEVGGDYYDVWQYDGGVKIALGDVTGHGLESGAIMMMAQTAARSIHNDGQSDPVQFLDILNRTLFDNIQRMKSDKSMTLLVLDYREGMLEFSGQHEELIIVRADGTLERFDTIDLGFPLALEREIADFVASNQTPLNPGDVLLLYTDGITEAFDLENKEYGIDRLCEVLLAHHECTSEEICQAIVSDVRNHIGKQKVFDDITMVAIKAID